MEYEPIINLLFLILIIWFSSLLLLGESGIRYHLEEKLNFIDNEFINELSLQLNIHKTHVIFFSCMLFISLWLLYFGIIDGCNLLIIITVMVMKSHSEINNEDLDQVLRYIVVVLIIWAFEILCQVNYSHSIFVITKVLFLMSLYMNNFRLLKDITNVIYSFYKSLFNNESENVDDGSVNVDDL